MRNHKKYNVVRKQFMFDERVTRNKKEKKNPSLEKDHFPLNRQGGVSIFEWMSPFFSLFNNNTEKISTKFKSSAPRNDKLVHLLMRFIKKPLFLALLYLFFLILFSLSLCTEFKLPVQKKKTACFLNESKSCKLQRQPTS